MFRILHRGNFFGQFKNNSTSLRRFFLSDAYKCTEAWENRLKAPIFRKLQFGNLYSELDKSFSSGRSISVLDVDIFANGIVDETYQNELEDVIYRLRSNPETSLMYDSTNHAVIRSLLNWNKYEDLLDILGQRMTYGLFPDTYLSILMIDMFLKQENVVSAVKIAVLQMLQEDCNHPILKGLSLYSCIKYLNSSDVWLTPKEEIDEDEEVVKVRIDYARNEYHDDHFDIIETNHLVGKTMCAFGKTVEDPIGTSSQLIGLILHEKFDLAKEFLSDAIKNNLPIHKEAIAKVKSYLETKPKQSIESESKDDEENQKVNENKVSSETQEVSPIKTEIIKLLDKFSGKDLEEPLETAIRKYVENEVKEHENQYIMKQCEIYKKWEDDRLRRIEEETMEEKRESVKMEIEKIRRELEEEERKIFYYDNELEHDELAKEKKAQIESVTYYIPKDKKRAVQKEGYTPPRIYKSHRDEPVVIPGNVEP